VCPTYIYINFCPLTNTDSLENILQKLCTSTCLSIFFLSAQSLLDEPNPNSPANSQAAQLYQENKREYEKRVSAIVEQSWRDC